jgi:hypothetical protein
VNVEFEINGLVAQLSRLAIREFDVWGQDRISGYPEIQHRQGDTCGQKERGSMRNRHHLALTVFAVCLLLGSLAVTSEAVYEGSANANMMIRRYERKGQFGKAALWREAAAECFDMISIPSEESATSI